MRKQVAAGRQAYIVYPVIEGPSDDQPELDFSRAEPEEEPAKPAKRAGKKSAKDRQPRSSSRQPTLKAATADVRRAPHGALSGLRLGLLHGRLDADDKEIIMRRFQRGEIDVLVSTTVIEVGVDVPNATVMVVEHAERFGLAQLHQLRGRVGRGSAKSYCILMTGGKVSPDAEQRLDAMVRTQDGFELAELDLQLRGPGEFFGTRQAGLPDFRVANLVRDRELLELAKREASAFVASRRSGSHRSRARHRRRPPQAGMAAALWPGGGRLMYLRGGQLSVIVGTGIDVIDIARIARSIERYGDHFLRRIYTAGEIAYCQRKRRNAAESFAARFAAKEAAAKALGTGIGFGVTWREIEVGREPDGGQLLHAARPGRGDRRADGRPEHLALHHPHRNAVLGNGDSGKLTSPRRRPASDHPSREVAFIGAFGSRFGTLILSIVVLDPRVLLRGMTSEVSCPVNRKCSGHN